MSSRPVALPKLVRRHEVRPLPKAVAAVAPAYLRPADTTKLVARPGQTSQRRTVSQSQYIRSLPAAPVQQCTPVLQPVVAKPRGLTRVPTARKHVKYVTPDNTSIDVERLGNIRGHGRGRLLVIIGNGPSISEIPLERLRDRPLVDLMSINRPDERVWPTRYWSFFDSSQAARHQALLTTYDGTIFNSTAIKQRRPNSIQMKNLGSSGFSRNLQKGFHIGQSSVYVALQIAYWLDYEHVYILGCDMSEVNGRLHFYGVNPDVTAADRKRRFANEAGYYDEAAKILTDQERSRYTFCSSYNPFPFVQKFGQLDHNVAIFEILDHANRLAAEGARHESPQEHH